MLRLATSVARDHVSGLVAVALAAFGATVLVVTTGVLAETSLRSHLPVGRLEGAAVVVTADQLVRPPGDLPVPLPERRRVPRSVVDELAALPGVSGAIGDVSFPAAALDRDGHPVRGGDPQVAGHGWSSWRLLPSASVTGTAPRAPDEVALDARTAEAAGHSLGDEVVVVTGGNRGVHTLTALVQGARGGIFLSDATAEALAGPAGDPAVAGVDLVGVLAPPGATDQVAAAARERLAGSGLQVLTGRAVGDAVTPEGTAGGENLLLVTASLAGTVLLLAGVVTTGAVSRLLEGQRRDLALLRAAGATPRQVRRLAVLQTTLAASAVVPLALPAGYLAAGPALRLLTDAEVVPAGLPLTLGPLPGLGAAVLTVAVIQAATWLGSRRASLLPVTAAVEAASVEGGATRGTTVAGACLLLASVTMSVTPLVSRSEAAAAGTATAGLVAAVGLGLCAPALVRTLGGAFLRRPGTHASAPRWLAATALASRPRRAAATVGGLGTLLAFALTYAVTGTTVLAAEQQEARRSTTAQVVLEAPALGGIPGDLADDVRQVPGVRAAVPVTTTTVLWSSTVLGERSVEAVPALAVSADAAGVVDLDVRGGDLGDLRGDAVALGVGTARSTGLDVGSRAQLVLGDGTPVAARVTAVYAADLAFGPVLLSEELAAGHTTSGLAEQLLVRTDGTTEAREGLERLAGATPGVQLRAADEGSTTSAGSPEQLLDLVVLAILSGYLLVGAASSLAAATTRRRNELGLLRLVGATPSQVRSVLLQESLLLGGAAVVGGLVVSVAPLALLAVGFLGTPVPVAPVWVVPMAAAVVASVLLLAVGVPGHRIARARPSSALVEA